ncbi:alpha-L-fucosidase [Edaphobacter acidisoli]|uniref:alpha-L-fucosidase n=1 Tax=Edaphobacter acidisoli TaxID=2040573 RepID=A0A916RKP3_9BACT|nr:alpha-L-fucosidase [Edaphobacter acidisoli]GGA60913.1 alpha-L-fucosidase [Edaphobacter acidisoli]
MGFDSVSRRSFMKYLGAAGVAASTKAAAQGSDETPRDSAAQAATRAQRLAWWRDAKFGMFIHWGLYSVIGHQEWVLESEGIPIPQYEILAKHFKPKPNAAREWARLAKAAGQKYMVMTTKHHEGFCMWDTKQTDYCAMKQGPGRDLVREFVEAARAEGLRVGFYYSLMDWHHPDGMRCATDEAARKRFVDYTHGLIRELMTNYGKIDILWYDVDLPLTPEQWESERMNRMVFELQPEIVVNNRNGLEGDFSTPEQKIEASGSGRAWESCMTLNQGWGFQLHDDEWKSPRAIIDNLATCAQQGGNYLVNIGPEADGTVPAASVRILETVGRWLEVNGRAIYATDGGASISFGNYDNFTRKGNTLFVHVYFWPSGTPAAEWLEFYKPATVVAFGGLNAKVVSAKVLKTGEKIAFTQDEISVRLTGLPASAPDDPVTVLELECDRPPVVDHHSIRGKWPRYRVGISG